MSVMGPWLLKNSLARNPQKFHRARMPYKRRSRFWWTFSIPPSGPFFQKRGFFNSHRPLHSKLPVSMSVIEILQLLIE